MKESYVTPSTASVHLEQEELGGVTVPVTVLRETEPKGNTFKETDR